jgi:ubiquinone/menaquinone biosynthesis C-methylase UbiE
MVAGGRGSDPSLDLLVFDGHTLPFADVTFSGCLFMAVLNCIPEESRQRQALSEILRVLKPGGILFISDYCVQDDPRNQERYRQGKEEFGTFGVFRGSGGGVFRHHKMPYIYRLLSGFELLEESSTEVKTMNGNPARIFQIMARKKDS